MYTVPDMARKKSTDGSVSSPGMGVIIERTPDVLTFTLDNSGHGNEITGGMFDAMLVELRKEASKPRARVLRVRARASLSSKPPFAPLL